MAKRLYRFIGEKCRVYRKDGNLRAKGVLYCIDIVRKIAVSESCDSATYCILMPKNKDHEMSLYYFSIGDIEYHHLLHSGIPIYNLYGKKLNCLGSQHKNSDTRGWFIEK